ncbi:hypothetical protein BHM03_00030691 [Ensete ventricosum]|nr:hypothetical protein BHM03_00030691 [Ensete ventricosum]
MTTYRGQQYRIVPPVRVPVPPVDRYVNCPQPGGTIYWGCFRPDFDCHRSLPGNKMSPPRLRQRGLGVVEDFSSVRGEEALAMLPRLLSRVRRRQRGFFSPREEKKRDDVTSAMLVTLPPLSNGKDLNLELPAQIDGLFGERRLEGRVIKDAAMPIHQSNPDTPTVLSA